MCPSYRVEGISRVQILYKYKLMMCLVWRIDMHCDVVYMFCCFTLSTRKSRVPRSPLLIFRVRNRNHWRSGLLKITIHNLQVCEKLKCLKCFWSCTFATFVFILISPDLLIWWRLLTLIDQWYMGIFIHILSFEAIITRVLLPPHLNYYIFRQNTPCFKYTRSNNFRF